MNKFTKKNQFLGIDISNETIDVSIVCQSNTKQFEDNKFANNLNGFIKMQQWLLKNKVSFSECLFCMEHTGTYGLLLLSWLNEKGIDFCVESGLQIKRSLGIARGKNDKIDARRIAIYALEHKHKLKPYVFPAKNLLQIKQLLTYREQLVKIRSSLKISLKSHEKYQQINQLKYISKDIEKQISQYDDKINFMEKKLKDIINDDDQLKKNFNFASSVKGIGLIITSFMLVTTNNFTSFENGRKYACYAGVAPFEHTSGTSIKGKTKVSHMAYKKLKILLSNGANSACKFDPEIKAYYKRKIDEGKDHKSVINAISCKLINRVFAVVSRQSNYVSLYQQKILQ